MSWPSRGKRKARRNASWLFIHCDHKLTKMRVACETSNVILKRGRLRGCPGVFQPGLGKVRGIYGAGFAGRGGGMGLHWCLRLKQGLKPSCKLGDIACQDCKKTYENSQSRHSWHFMQLWLVKKLGRMMICRTVYCKWVQPVSFVGRCERNFGYWIGRKAVCWPLWRLAVPPVDPWSHPHNLAVDGSWNAVVHLAVDLRQGIGCKQRNINSQGSSRWNWWHWRRRAVLMQQKQRIHSCASPARAQSRTGDVWCLKETIEFAQRGRTYSQSLTHPGYRELLKHLRCFWQWTAWWPCPSVPWLQKPHTELAWPTT